MEIIKYPGREEWSSLIKRPALDVNHLVRYGPYGIGRGT